MSDSPRRIVSARLLKPTGVIGILLILMLTARFASAHANLIRSDPPSNAVLDAAPAVIKLWFSETLEPEYSGVEVLDSSGNRVNASSSVIDPDDATSMSVAPGPLPDGVYVVAWHNVSGNDGHPLTGNFPFIIGRSSGALPAASDADPAPPAARVLVQWLLLLTSGIVIGGAAFWLFIWARAPSGGQARAERWMLDGIWISYGLFGLATALSLVEQSIQISGAATPDLLISLISTRYGLIWLARAAIWIILGGALRLARKRTIGWWIVVGAGGAFLVTTALLSHSASADIPIPALTADWLHLAASSLWVGGLAAFAIALYALRQNSSAVRLRATLVSYFSNMARVAVAVLLLTGVYATWLHIGETEALLDTRYGQLLMLKLLLIVPLLLIAGVNLALTEQRLAAAAQSGTPTRWSGILRGLVSAEAILTALVLLAVGALTSSAPARGVIEARQSANAPSVQDASYWDMQMTPAMHVILNISPGYAGTNSFALGLYDFETTEPISDATLVKLQFTPQDALIGKSTLEATPHGIGQYTVTGANLGVAGDWKVRVSVQRPNRYDEIVDFKVSVPPPPAAPVREPLPMQRPALLLLGEVAVICGAVFLAVRRADWKTGGGLLAIALVGCGAVFMMAGLFMAAG